MSLNIQTNSHRCSLHCFISITAPICTHWVEYNHYHITYCPGNIPPLTNSPINVELKEECEVTFGLIFNSYPIIADWHTAWRVGNSFDDSRLPGVWVNPTEVHLAFGLYQSLPNTQTNCMSLPALNSVRYYTIRYTDISLFSMDTNGCVNQISKPTHSPYIDSAYPLWFGMSIYPAFNGLVTNLKFNCSTGTMNPTVCVHNLQQNVRLGVTVNSIHFLY